MGNEGFAIDAAVRRYAPRHSSRKWVKSILIGILVGWLIGTLAYGIPLLNRYTNVRHSEIVAAQNRHYNDLLNMVAGQKSTTGQGELGRLASRLRELRGFGYPNMVALGDYSVYPGEFARASKLVGGGLTTQQDPVTDYGHFEPRFLNNVVEAIPAQVGHALRPTNDIRYWGNLRWQYLVLASTGLWAGVALIGLLLLAQRKLWEVRARRRFVAGLEYEDLQVLKLVNRMLQHPGKLGYVAHLDQADRLWALVQRRGEDPKADPDRDIDEELRQLQAIYGDSR